MSVLAGEKHFGLFLSELIAVDASTCWEDLGIFVEHG